jgi:hypothetical protein
LVLSIEHSLTISRSLLMYFRKMPRQLSSHVEEGAHHQQKKPVVPLCLVTKLRLPFPGRRRIPQWSPWPPSQRLPDLLQMRNMISFLTLIDMNAVHACDTPLAGALFFDLSENWVFFLTRGVLRGLEGRKHNRHSSFKLIYQFK